MSDLYSSHLRRGLIKRLAVWVCVMFIMQLVISCIYAYFQYEKILDRLAVSDTQKIQTYILNTELAINPDLSKQSPGEAIIVLDVVADKIISSNLQYRAHEVKYSAFLKGLLRGSDTDAEAITRHLAGLEQDLKSQLTHGAFTSTKTIRMGNYAIKYASGYPRARVWITDVHLHPNIQKDLYHVGNWSEIGLSSDLDRLTIDGLQLVRGEAMIPMRQEATFQLGDQSIHLQLVYDKAIFIKGFIGFQGGLALTFTALMLIALLIFWKSDRVLYGPVDELLHQMCERPFMSLQFSTSAMPYTDWEPVQEHYNKLIMSIKKQVHHYRMRDDQLNKSHKEILDANGRIAHGIEAITRLNSNMLASVYENHQQYYNMINAMANAIEAKDHYTRGHCDRVMKYSVMIGEKYGLSEQDMQLLRYGAVLHDIGKIGIHESVLNKTSPLKPEERSFIEKHPVIGESIINELDFLGGAKEIVRHHHERYDGTGYPSRLKGEAIPLLARIVCIADAFDAMTSSRPYRETAMSTDEAIERLIRGQGLQFDPDLLAIFIGLVREAL